MNAMPSPKRDSLVLLVPAEVEVPEPAASHDEIDQVQEEGLDLTKPLKRVFHRAMPQSVELAKLQNDLDRVQGEVDDLLKERTDHTVGGMRLNEVEVSLGISAEGSIGIVTAGITASITLVYARA